MAHWTVGAFPRNTSNGDYGRFLFTSPSSSLQANGTMISQNPSYTTDGNRMMQHVHYPNCPNRLNNNNNGGGGGCMPEYTIEYGEDAVRKALGGSMPDFQAQFQQQYGNGGGDGTASEMNLQAVQMMNNGKSKVAMIPVVLANDDGDAGGTGDGQGASNATPNAKSNAHDANCPQGSPPNQSENQRNEGAAPQSTEQGSEGSIAQNGGANVSTSATTTQAGKPKPPKPEAVLNAFDSVRKIRSSSAGKYGRIVRPAYWSPDIPNPCRKKTGSGAECSNESGMLQQQQQQPPMQDVNGNPVTMISPSMMTIQQNNGMMPPMVGGSYAGDYGYGAYMNPQMMTGQATAGFQETNAISQPPQGQVQRARSLPPRKPSRPTYSLCGKCKKCKNLGSDDTQPPILAFPKYSSGNIPLFDDQQNPHQRGKLTTTSSQLGQSAKNFRAIRFSSHR